MLAKLLQLMAEGGGIITVAELARKVGVGEPTLRMMLDELVRLGYLEDARHGSAGDGGCGPACHAGCSSCPSAKELPALWRVTEKGRLFLGEQGDNRRG